MKNFLKLKKLGEICFYVFIELLSISRSILVVFGIVLILFSVPFYIKEIENAQLPTEIVEVPPGIKVWYLDVGGWLLWQRFVVVNPPGIFGDYKEWIRQYDREHPFDPEIVKKLLEKEKNAKTNLNMDKYTDEQKKDNRVAYRRIFYRESTLTPRNWDGKQATDLYEYKDHILMYTFGFVEGFDKVKWPDEKEVEK